MSSPSPNPPPNADLAQIVAQLKAENAAKNIPPYLGGVAENYIAPWQQGMDYSTLGNRVVYGPMPTTTAPFRTAVSPAGYASLQVPANPQTYGGPVEPIGAAPTGVKPKYRSGDEQTVINGLAPESVFSLKQKLVDSGLASKNILSSGGFWDSGSANAMQDVLGYANVHGLTWQDSMDQLAAESTTHPKPTALLPPQILSTKSPIDLRQTADTVAQATIGRKLTKAEQARFVTAWQTADLGYQKQQADITLAYQQAQQDITNNGTTPTNLPPQESTLTAPPTPENAAKEALQNTPEGQAKSIADVGNTFMGLLKGIVPGAGG